MKVNRTQGAQPNAPSRAASKASNSRFSLDETDEAARSARASAASPLASIDALIALQSNGDIDPDGKRKRSIDRGNALLDLLDDVKVAVLSGQTPKSNLKKLAAAIREQRENAGDPALDGVLEEIELRARVELAKHGEDADVF